MDTKNIIAAISLSAAVIILYSLFFAPSPPKANSFRKNNSTVPKTHLVTHHHLTKIMRL